MISSQISACRKTAIIWKELARTGSGDKREAAQDTLGDVGRYFNDCPCCEFVNTEELEYLNCQSCPMKDFWGNTSDENYLCQGGKFQAPYGAWVEAAEYRSSRIKLAARKIYTLAVEATEYWEAMRDMNLTY